MVVDVGPAENGSLCRSHASCRPDASAGVTRCLAFTSVAFRSTSEEALKTEHGAVAVDDLGRLPLLHEPAVLLALQRRFDERIVYTFSGPVNPFQTVGRGVDPGTICLLTVTSMCSCPQSTCCRDTCRRVAQASTICARWYCAEPLAHSLECCCSRGSVL